MKKQSENPIIRTKHLSAETIRAIMKTLEDRLYKETSELDKWIDKGEIFKVRLDEDAMDAMVKERRSLVKELRRLKDAFPKIFGSNYRG